MDIIAFQPEFRPALPVVFGAKDYRDFRSTLVEMDRILVSSGIEHRFINQRIAALEGAPSPRQIQRHFKTLRLALHHCILLGITGLSFRAPSRQMADSVLCQRFTHSGFVDAVRPASKSTLERFEKMFTAGEVAELALGLAVADGVGAQQLLYRETALRFDAVFADTTCVKSNIHFPVDWVLLRDATRTLTNAVALIRARGLKHRMARPVATPATEGFDAPANDQLGIINAICPRSVPKLREKLEDEGFCLLQKRRGGTKARIGIFKNAYLGKPLRSKGHKNRELRIEWCILGHNLWKLAAMAAQKRQELEAKAAAA